jgi:hypothetical protein
MVRAAQSFFWIGVKRWQLKPHYSHFILVPGGLFDVESWKPFLDRLKKAWALITKHHH